MSNDVLFIIPARGGSTRVANKNLQPLAGKPLVSYAINNCIKTGIGDVIVSTNDDEIAAVARSFGASVPFKRPEHLSNATAASIWVILHALKWIASQPGKSVPSYVALCPPTNPFISSESISAMVATLVTQPLYHSIVPVYEPDFHPFTLVDFQSSGLVKPGLIRINDRSILDIERSQDYPRVFAGSPACRITRSAYFLKILEQVDEIELVRGKTYDPDSCLGHEISRFEAHDINTLADLKMAEFYLSDVIK
jgi:CMP-N-acetylneuraminic acid synthetase